MVPIIPPNKAFGTMDMAIGKTDLGLIKELKAILVEGIQSLLFNCYFMPGSMACGSLVDNIGTA
ncbi:hypothetical protein NYF23_07590 [SAR92 clade bacterium H455]|uniref:Uncharacterized protein n=1 Tax=SAR92 clade bacterium H455 TaxID=2974818 RepID=A0ABY5TJE9_9GAMM|nr:hypothetical protein NYF23_07590 [SAR92 clade bacterium H455]